MSMRENGPPAPLYEEVQALLARAMPRHQVILATLPDSPLRLDHVERKDVMVIPKGDWIQIMIWLTAWAAQEEP